MRIIAKNLNKYMVWRDLSVIELVARVNKVMELAEVGKKPITRQSIYDYFNHKAAPPPDRMYAICAVLRVKPDKIFTTEIDHEKYEKFLDFARGL